MNTAVIITAEPGHVPPRGYIQTALKECPTCCGIAIQDKEGEAPVLDTSVNSKQIDIDDLMKILEGTKDQRTLVYLGKMTQDFNPEDDVQPFIFQQATQGDGDPEDILAVFIEGDFPNYSKPGDGHTDEYWLWEKFIFPMLLEKFEASDDLEDFYRRIRSSTFEQAVMNTVSHRAAAVFVPLVGDIIAFGRNELGGKFDWGTTSNRFGWGDQTVLDKAASTAVAAVKKGGSRLSRLMGSTAVPTPAPEAPKENPPGVHNTADVNKSKPAGTNPFEKWPGTSAATHTMRAVPVGLQGNARNRWIRLFLGLSPDAELPKGKDHKDFMIPVANDLVGFAQEQVTTNDAVKQLSDRVKRFQAPGSVSEQMKEAAGVSGVKNPQRPAEQPADSPRSAADFLPESPADEAKATTELVTEWATNPKRPPMLDIQRIEAKWPLFSVSKGIKFEDMAHWSIANIKQMAKKYPNEMARAFSEMRLKVFELGGFKEEPAVKPADKQVEVPSPQPGPAQTTKKSRLARLTGNAA